MGLIFLGSPGVENYVEGDKNMTRPYQQFKAGVKLVRETYMEKRMENVPVVGADGKAVVDSGGNQMLKPVEKTVEVTMTHQFRPSDIDKPYDKCRDEAGVLKAYPRMFKKV